MCAAQAKNSVSDPRSFHEKAQKPGLSSVSAGVPE